MCFETYSLAKELEIEARRARASLEAKGEVTLTEAEQEKRVPSRKRQGIARAKARAEKAQALESQLSAGLLERLKRLLGAWPRSWSDQERADRLGREILKWHRSHSEQVVLTKAEHAWIWSQTGTMPVLGRKKSKPKGRPNQPSKPTWSTKKARRAMDREARLRGVT